MHVWMCCVSSTPSSAMPVAMSSRLTAAANSLALSFFFTLLGSRLATPSGRTFAQATMKPERLRHRRQSRRPAVFRMSEDRRENFLVNVAPLVQELHRHERVLVARRMLLPVHVVQHAAHPPPLNLIRLQMLCVRAHARGDALHVRA